VQLATDLYFPADGDRALNGPFPVLLTRTPYDKNSLIHETRGHYYARRGYIVAMQDVRGRYASEGTFYPFTNEAPDGYDTVEWLGGKPWCTGKVGTFGESYEAGVQNALACLNPPHLAAMVPVYGCSSYFHCSMRHNGALEMRLYMYAFIMASTSKEAMADPCIQEAMNDVNANLWDWVRAFPIRKGCTPLRLVPSYEAWAIDISTHGTYDDYWKSMGYGPRPYYDLHADVPSLYIGGWYDSYPRSTVENFVELKKRKKTPVHMLLGPWVHGSRGGDAVVGDARFPHPADRLDYDEVHLQWFDRWLKDIPNGGDESGPAEYFVMGGGPGLQEDHTILPGGEWRPTSAWPPPESEPTPFYVHADGVLSEAKPDEEEGQTTYRFDPADPVPTVGGNLSPVQLKPGMYDQRQDARFAFTNGTMPLSSRQDVLCFMTPPLTEPMEIVGPIEAVMYVATDGPDTDFTAKLIDVYPPAPGYPEGCAANLTDSIGRLRFRDGYEEEHLAEPGTVYQLRFELYPTANRFVPGHQIRVDISSSNFPRFELNPNTGGPLGRERGFRVARNTLYHNKSRPSHILLPVVRG